MDPAQPAMESQGGIGRLRNDLAARAGGPGSGGTQQEKTGSLGISYAGYGKGNSSSRWGAGGTFDVNRSEIKPAGIDTALDRNTPGKNIGPTASVSGNRRDTRKLRESFHG